MPGEADVEKVVEEPEIHAEGLPIVVAEPPTYKG